MDLEKHRLNHPIALLAQFYTMEEECLKELRVKKQIEESQYCLDGLLIAIKTLFKYSE